MNRLVPSHVHKDGHIPLVGVVVLLTEDHEILLKGICPVCKIVVDCYTPIEQLWRQCPPRAEPEAKWTLKDIADLAALKITLPEAPQLPPAKSPK